jgi:tetratricopeptide (TPR) repeat protein
MNRLIHADRVGKGILKMMLIKKSFMRRVTGCFVLLPCLMVFGWLGWPTASVYGQAVESETDAATSTDVDEIDLEVPEEESSPAIDLLDKATQKKLFAKRMSDLNEVVEMCEEAIEDGLPAQSEAYAKELMAGTLFEKANQVLAPVLQGKLDRSWRQRRRMAMESLTKAAEIQPEHGDVQLLIAQLADLPDGDKEAGMVAAENAVKLMWDNPARRCEALLTRASFRETPAEQLGDIEAAVAANDTNDEALRERAQIYLDMDRIDDAIADLSRIIELDESDTDTREQVVQLLTATEKYDEAIAFVDEFIEQDKTSARGYILRSSILLDQGETEKALADIEKAIEVEPNSTIGLLLRAQVYANDENFEEAYADLERVLELEPGDPQALLLRSSVAQIEGNFEAAIRDLNRLLRRNPDNLELRLQIAATYLMDKRPSRAIDIYTRIIREDETEWQALRGRADAYLGVGKHQEAIKDYEQALPHSEDDAGILNNYAWVLATSTDDAVRDGSKAIELAERACEVTNYEAAHILSTLAAAHAESGDFEKALEWSQKAVDLGAENEIDDQLKQELASYKAKKPWREMQKQEDRIPEPEVSEDDLELSDADKPLESAKIPSDP